MLNPMEIHHLRKIFQQIDKDHTGSINIKELEEALNMCGFKNTYEEVKSVMA